MRCHQPTKDPVARRTGEGKTKTEIMLRRKRYVARETFPLPVVSIAWCEKWQNRQPGRGVEIRENRKGRSSVSCGPVQVGDQLAGLIVSELIFTSVFGAPSPEEAAAGSPEAAGSGTVPASATFLTRSRPSVTRPRTV